MATSLLKIKARPAKGARGGQANSRLRRADAFRRAAWNDRKGPRVGGNWGVAARLWAPDPTVASAPKVIAAAASLVLALHLAPCPYNPHARGCADPEARVVYVHPASPPKLTRAHELGHIASRWLLNEAERLRIQVVAGWRRWREERFADAFAVCGLGRIEGIADYGKASRALCAEIRRATERPLAVQPAL